MTNPLLGITVILAPCVLDPQEEMTDTGGLGEQMATKLENSGLDVLITF